MRRWTSYRCAMFSSGRVVFPCVRHDSCDWSSLFFKALICSVSLLISICCLETVSTDTARLAANSARGVPFATVCVAAAAMLSSYPSKESSIWWDIVGVLLSFCSVLFPMGTTPNCAKPPKGFCSPSLTASERLFATYTARNMVFQYSQVWSASGSFDHSRVYVSYSPDCRSNFNATACKYLLLITSFARFDLRCATSIALMNCGTSYESL